MANTKIKKQKTHKLYVSDINPGLTDLSIEKKKRVNKGSIGKRKKRGGPIQFTLWMLTFSQTSDAKTQWRDHSEVITSLMSGSRDLIKHRPWCGCCGTSVRKEGHFTKAKTKTKLKTWSMYSALNNLLGSVLVQQQCPNSKISLKFQLFQYICRSDLDNGHVTEHLFLYFSPSLCFVWKNYSRWPPEMFNEMIWYISIKGQVQSKLLTWMGNEHHRVHLRNIKPCANN